MRPFQLQAEHQERGLCWCVTHGCRLIPALLHMFSQVCMQHVTITSEVEDGKKSYRFNRKQTARVTNHEQPWLLQYLSRLRRNLITADPCSSSPSTSNLHFSRHHSSHLRPILSSIRDTSTRSLQINAHLEQSPRPPPHLFGRTLDQCARQTTRRSIILEYLPVLKLTQLLRIDRVECECG